MSSMQEMIINIIAEVKDDEGLVDKLSGATDINALGMDSLQMLNFMLMVEDEYDIEIDFDDFNFADIGSIDAFCQFIHRNMLKDA